VRNPDRIEVVLEVLRKVWKANPDLRLGQILVNAGDYHRQDSHHRTTAEDLFSIEDGPLVKAMEEQHFREATTVLPR